MLRQFTAGLLATAAFIAPLPASALKDGSADDLGVMSISLKDVVKPTIGFPNTYQVHVACASLPLILQLKEANLQQLSSKCQKNQYLSVDANELGDLPIQFLLL